MATRRSSVDDQRRHPRHRRFSRRNSALTRNWLRNRPRHRAQHGHAKALAEIKQKLHATYQPVPLVADVHHNGMKIALEVAKHVDKVRINPGLYVFEKPTTDRTEYTPAEFGEIGDKIRETLEPLVISLRDQGKALRNRR